MASAALPLITSGLGGLFSAIGGSKSKTATQSSETKSSGEQSANLDKKQRKVNKALFQKILEAIQMGPAVSQSDKNTTRGQINDTYDSTDDNIAANMAARGFTGGKVGGAFRSTALDRSKSLQTNDATLRDQAQNRFMQMIQAAFQFNTPRNFTSSQQSQTTGTATQPGNSPWSYAGAGLGDLSGYLYGRQMGAFGGGAAPGAGMNPNMIVPPCHIAFELWGDDWRTFVLRTWLLGQARQSLAWTIAVGVYARTGRSLARWIRWHQPSRRVALRFFNRLVTRAISV